MTGFCDLNLKFPLIKAMSVFMSSQNFMLSWVEPEKSFITSRPGGMRKTDSFLRLKPSLKACFVVVLMVTHNSNFVYYPNHTVPGQTF